MTELPRRGEVWWCEVPDLAPRPVVVLSRDQVVPRTNRVTIAPCTTTVRGLSSEVVLEPGEDPVVKTSAVNLDSLQTVGVGTMVRRLGRLSDLRMHQVCAALHVAVHC